MVALTACNKDDEDNKEVKADRTVLIYISGECSLWDYVDIDLDEIKTGSMSIGDNNLLVYVDRGSTREIPWLARVKKGQFVDSVSIKNIADEMNLNPARTSVADDPYSSEGQVMEGVIRYAFKKYPSKNNDYALGLWGHGSGWLMRDSVAYTAMARKAYGVDNGRNGSEDFGKWMNIPTMAKVLSKLPHLTYIFCDCCNMMCLETAYELRNVTDYIIGSPAEIPGEGGPYDKVVPAMFEKGTINNVPSFAKSIIDYYYEQRASGYDLPLSVVRIYDANDFILKYAEPADYNNWKQVLDKAVIYKKMAENWMIDKNSVKATYWERWDRYYGSYFTVTEEKYGGVSMFVPTYPQRTSNNIYIQRMGWYYAAGYNEIGW